MIKNRSKKMRVSPGFMSLVTVLIIAALAFAVGIGLLTASIDSGLTSDALTKSARARSLVNACSDYALQLMRSNNAFTGSGSRTFSGKTCAYQVQNTGGNNRTITASSTIDGIVRKALITTTAFSPRITIGSWQEVEGF